MTLNVFITNSDQLHQLGYLDEESYRVSKHVEELYPIKIPYYYLELAQKNDSRCPILLQCVPSSAEIAANMGGMDDPIGDNAHEVEPGLLHRYPNRLLIIPTRECFAYCRFCFRKNLKERGQIATTSNALRYLEKHPEITEVILSGGDPLFLTDSVLADWFSTIESQPAIERLRIHTRAPVVFPSRFDESLYAILKAAQKLVTISIHINHPKELTKELKGILVRLRRMGILTVSQTVLLRGVNDSSEILGLLFDSLLSAGCTPYYLHQLDSVRGGNHFACKISDGAKIVSGLWGLIAGAAIPTYVVDIPGGWGKVPVDIQRCENKNGSYKVHGLDGYIGFVDDIISTRRGEPYEEEETLEPL